MATVQLYLTINNLGLDDNWNKNLSSTLKTCKGVKQVSIIGHNENGNAQINVDYEINEANPSAIEGLIFKSGATITAMNIHFPSEITGISDAFGASAISFSLDETIGALEGIIGVSISAGGTIKVEMDPLLTNKNVGIQKILKALTLIRTRNS